MASKSKKGKGAKPAWALTEKATEDAKEAEIDELLEFAYELDYEKYMEDYEVRQALAVIKERVADITKDDDWKQRMADEWNAAEETAPAEELKSTVSSKCASQLPLTRFGAEPAAQSQASGASKASFSSRVKEAKAKEAESKPEWNASTTSEARRGKLSAEDRMAAQIAGEVLRDNAKLRAVHSKDSIRAILEKEARKQMKMANGGEYKPPVIARTQEHVNVNKVDPSNLPYLHKNPAV